MLRKNIGNHYHNLYFVLSSLSTTQYLITLMGCFSSSYGYSIFHYQFNCYIIKTTFSGFYFFLRETSKSGLEAPFWGCFSTYISNFRAIHIVNYYYLFAICNSCQVLFHCFHLNYSLSLTKFLFHWYNHSHYIDEQIEIEKAYVIWQNLINLVISVVKSKPK